jgi:hypothetical protein
MFQLLLWFISLPQRLRALLTPRPPSPIPTPPPPPTEEEPDEPNESSEPPEVSWLDEVCARLGVERERDSAGASWWRRGAHRLEVIAADSDEADGRAALWSQALGVRLGAYTLEATWSPEIERPAAPEQVFRKEDIPSPTGDRLPWLIRSETLFVWEQITGMRAVSRPWLVEGLSIIFVLEIGRRLHVLTEEQAAASLGATKLIEDARTTWFYSSYKAKSKVTKTPHGALKVWATTDGSGASRAWLLPDLDWDTARTRGFAAVPSREALWTFELAEGADRDEALAWFRAQVASAYRGDEWPLSAAVLGVDQDGAWVERGTSERDDAS